MVLCVIVLASCSSRPASKSTRSAPVTSVPSGSSAPQKHQWDYDRIRDAREAEEAQTPPSALRARSDEDSCTVMTRSQMIRSKASGCRPMDPREGGGEDSFCCPSN